MTAASDLARDLQFLCPPVAVPQWHRGSAVSSLSFHKVFSVMVIAVGITSEEVRPIRK